MRMGVQNLIGAIVTDWRAAVDLREIAAVLVRKVS